VTPESLAWLAGQSVDIDEEQLRAALRRAVLLVAAGGDPHRDLQLDSRAVTALAADLATPDRVAALTAALDQLREEAATLAADPDLAWRALACGLLAEELADSNEQNEQ
jgi:hypothetical protein